MKAITLTQPWATLVAIGAKQIETRSWATRYRGPLAIHAAAGLGPVGGRRGLVRVLCGSPFQNTLGPIYGYGVMNIDAMPRGAIVARCELVDCVPTWPSWATVEPWFVGARKGVGQHYYEVPPPADSNERAFGDYTPGRYAWLLADVQPLGTPIPARGQLGLWNWEGSL